MKKTPFDHPDIVLLSYPRSGSHLLCSGLSSHPRIHCRGECVLRFERRNKKWHGEMPRDWIRAFLNKPGHINLAIVMYPMVNLFEKLCGPLRDYRILHLTRDPRAVVRSLVQAEADKKAYGSAFKAHFRVSENPPPHAPISLVGIDKRIRRIAGLQTRYTRKLKKYKNVFTVTYESLTGDQEIAEIPEAIASKMLSYLGLDFAKLATDLQKTGTAHP